MKLGQEFRKQGTLRPACGNQGKPQSRDHQQVHNDRAGLRSGQVVTFVGEIQGLDQQRKGLYTGVAAM